MFRVCPSWSVGLLSWMAVGCAAARVTSAGDSLASSPRPQAPPMAAPLVIARVEDEPTLRPRCVASAFSEEASRGEPKSAQASVLAMLAREPLRAVIATAQPRIGACWRDAMLADAALRETRLTMRFVIVPDGTVACAESVSLDPAPAAAGEALAACVATALMELRFSPTSRGAITVNYPFVFAATP